MGKLSKKFSQYNEQTGEYIETTFHHLDLPEDLNNPVIDGIERTMNLNITRAPGWHYADNAMLFIPAYKKVSGQSLIFKISHQNKDGKPNRDGLVLEFSGSGSFSKKIPIGDIFNVVFNIVDADQIRSLVGVNSDLLTHRYIKKKSGKLLIDSIKNKKISSSTDLTYKLKTMLTTQTRLESPDRLYDILSLSHFIGCSLANDLEVGNIMYEKFTPLDSSMVFNLEHSGLNSVNLITSSGKHITVTLVNQLYCNLKTNEIDISDQVEFSKLEIKNNEFIFKGKSYSKEGAPRENTLLIYCAIINRLFVFPEADINFSMQDYKNQKIVTFADTVDDLINEDLERVQNKIDSTGSLLKGVSGHYFETGRVTRMIKTDESAIAVITKNENPLAKTSQGKLLVRNVEFLSKEAIGVLPQDLATIDPVDTAESKNIGKSTPLTLTTEVGEDGSLITPLYKVVNGEVTKDIDMVHVADLPKLFVAEAGAELKGNVLAKHQDMVKLFPSHVITHVRVSPFSTTSACRGSSAFIENTDQKRTQMTANAQKQARTILRPSRALLETGIESIVANGDAGVKNKYTVEDLFKENGVSPETISGHKFEIVEIQSTSTGKEFRLTSTSNANLFTTFFVNTEKTPYGSAYYYELVAPSDLTEFYQSTDIVYKQHNVILSGKVEGSSALDYHTKGKEEYFDHTIANGKDLFVMFGFSSSFTVDDASTMSDALVRDLSLSTPVLVTKHFKKNKIFNSKIEECFGFAKGVVLDGYDSKGLPLIGSYLKPGSYWLYKYEKNILTGVPMESNLRLSSYEHGEVISIEDGKEEIRVTLAKWVHVEVGDKFSARHGNKTIVARVMPAELMPYDPVSGRHVDMIINPLGIPSRGNISQIAEMQMTAEVKAQGLDSKVVPPFSNELMRMVENYESGKGLTELQLINPQTGLYYPHKHFCGYMHYLRNYKISEEQLHAVGDSQEVDPAFGQPTGTSELHEKGQSISSMEKEILVSYGAKGILNEIHSVLSADHKGFREVMEFFGENPEDPYIDFEGKNLHSEHMQHAALSFHVSLKQEGGKVCVDYLSDSDMDSYTEISMHDVDNMLTSKAYLNDMMYIPLGRKFITPVAIRKFSFTNIIEVNKIGVNTQNRSKSTVTKAQLGKDIAEQIIEGRTKFAVASLGDGLAPKVYTFPADMDSKYLEQQGVSHMLHQTGILALIELLEQYPIELWIEAMEKKFPKGISAKGEFNKKNFKILERAKQNASTGGFDKFITTRFPVLPSKYRQGKNEINKKDSFTAGYKDIVLRAQDYQRNPDSGAHLYRRAAEMMLPSSSGGTNQRISLYELWSKKDLGGRIRSKILKTRVLCSMRSTIVPMFSGDPAKFGYPAFAGHPDSIGLPLVGALRIAQPRLYGYLKKHHTDIIKGLTEIDAISKVIDILTLPLDSVAAITDWPMDTIADRVRSLKKELIDFVNGSLVFFGRAPSLHETSLRGGRVYIHEENVIHLNSLLTTDLNADHDGDQIYVVMPVTEEAVKDIEERLLPSCNALRYNDGKPSLAISQDALLGLYFATSEPTSQLVRPVSSIDEVKYYLEIGLLGMNDLVVMTLGNELQVKSTVGRLIVHNIIYGFGAEGQQFLTKNEADGFYVPKYNQVISGNNISDIQTNIANEFNFSSKYVTDIYHELQKFGYQCVEIRNLTVGIKDLTPALAVESINAEVKEYVEIARTLEELGLLPEDYLDHLDRKVSKRIKELKIMSLVPDDNAFKILTVSGAKGKVAGIEKMFGVQGFIKGVGGATIATPILSNTVRGISQFQVEDLSYTQRENALSTVLETSKPGEALRTGAFALSGLIIEENQSNDNFEQLCYYVKRTHSKEVTLGSDPSKAVPIESDENYHYKGKPLTKELVKELSYLDSPRVVLDEDDSYLFLSDEKTVTVSVGKDRASAVVAEEFPDFNYKGQPLYQDMIRQLCGSILPQIPLDEEGYYLFLEVDLHPFAKKYFKNKMDLNGKLVTDRKLWEMLESYPSHIPIATHANEFSVEYGITQKHAGYRAGSKKPYKIGENIGIKASTATGQPASQLVISKRNMESEAGLANGITMFKDAIQNAKYYGSDYRSYELLAPANGTVEVQEIPAGTLFKLTADNGVIYEHFIPAEDEINFDILVENYDIVFMGQTIVAPLNIVDGERQIHPVASFAWNETTIVIDGQPIKFKDALINPTRDLVQLVRFYIMIYLESIYRMNKINLDPNHYGSFALQQARYCSVIHSNDDNLKGYLNVATYLNDVAPNNPNVVVELKATRATDTILLNSGPIAALCYREAIDVVSRASQFGSLREFGSLGKVAIGLSIDKDLADEEIIVNSNRARKTIRYKQTDSGDDFKFNLKSKEENVYTEKESSSVNNFWEAVESVGSEVGKQSSNPFDSLFDLGSDPLSDINNDTDYEKSKTQIAEQKRSNIFGGDK